LCRGQDEIQQHKYSRPAATGFPADRRQIFTHFRPGILVEPNRDTVMKASCSCQDGFELCFQSLQDPQQEKSFPCDEGGHVDMDRLEQCVLHEYLYARAVVGKEFCRPSVRRRPPG
jgi:hypothetical protein